MSDTSDQQRPLAVIFDMDGVLVDSYRAHLRSWQDTAMRFGVGMSEGDFARTFGRTSREIIRTLWPERFDEDAVREFDSAKEQRYREILQEQFPEMPGASTLIEALHAAGFRLAIGSSGPPANVAVVRDQLSAGRRIDATVTGAEVRHGKPNPEVFLRAAEKLRVQPRDCAVIEDAPVGVEAARRAGMAAIGLTGTASREQLQHHADLVVDSLAELSPARIRSVVESRREP